MSSPDQKRLLLGQLPALALLALAVVLISGADPSAPLILLLLAPVASQVIVAIVGKRLPAVVSATLVTVVSLGVLALGPSMLPLGHPLWLFGVFVAAIPRSSTVAVELVLALLLAGGASLGLLRAGAETMTIAVAAVAIFGAGLCAIASKQLKAEKDDCRGRAILEEVARKVRMERTELERSVEDRMIALQTTNRELEREALELRSSKEQALEASRIKSSFLANVSHELRTPLNAIIGYTEMLLEDADVRADETAVTDQRIVLESANNLLKIVDDILDLTKIEAGKLGIKVEVFPVVELVESLGSAVLPLVRRNENTLKLKYGRELGYIRTDRTKLNRVLLELLSNACKFTRAGRIELRVDPAVVDGRRYFVFSVTDTGIGIPEVLLGRLFESFRMADESSTRRYGGLGLGLALAKHYSEMLGGEISVESTPDEGSVFRVRLPAEPEDPKTSGHILVSTF